MTSHLFKWAMAVSIALITVACVTINVYFTEAAAEDAADRFIQDVIGTEQNVEQTAADSMLTDQPRSLLAMLADIVIPSAHAQQANIDIQSAQIQAIQDRMQARFQSDLERWFESGVIGYDNRGLVAIRDRSLVGLSERRALEQTVREENADRDAVYREIAVANGQPDWEDDIRSTFSRRWVANAPSGWYYQDNAGNWQRK
ncbi:MAG: YdbL family protein [Pseudomonadota bacterium]